SPHSTLNREAPRRPSERVARGRRVAVIGATRPRHARPCGRRFLRPGLAHPRRRPCPAAHGRPARAAGAGHVGCTGRAAMTSTPPRSHRHWPLVLLPGLALAVACPAANDEPLALEQGMADAAPTPAA